MKESMGSSFWKINNGLNPILGSTQNNIKHPISKINKKNDLGKVTFLFNSFLLLKNKEDISQIKNRIVIIKINNLIMS